MQRMDRILLPVQRIEAIDATAAKANSETLGAMEEEIDTLNADNAGGNSFLTFFRNLFGTNKEIGGGEYNHYSLFCSEF